MSEQSVGDWLEERATTALLIFAKRLAANDTLATNSHQAGPYLPKALAFRAFPGIDRPDFLNPDARFELIVDSHAEKNTARIIWYNNKLHRRRFTEKHGSRDETRITRLGGHSSALLNPENTGAIALFAFEESVSGEGVICRTWVTQGAAEEDVVQGSIGPIEPKDFLVWEPAADGAKTNAFSLFRSTPATRSCRLESSAIPQAWLEKFPSGEELIDRALQLRPRSSESIDQRLVSRRNCEFEIFLSVERAFYTPAVSRGFGNLDQFLGLAQSILQSRKSRAGNSLELHMKAILIEEAFQAGKHFCHRPIVEGNKRPDFLFPSLAAYNDSLFPSSKLRMLAVKTSCKDRWRQVINEAGRIGKKHLLTLQEGVSEPQYREMHDAGINLVVPRPLHRSYPKSIRPHLVSVEQFIRLVRESCH